MDTSAQSQRDRTDAKLRYAQVHFAELKEHGLLNGNDFERAHQESFLFHLLGVRDALLAEINIHYGAGLAKDALSLGKLRAALTARGLSSPELKTLYELEKDTQSWYSIAKLMRDHSAHVQGVSRRMLVGGKEDGIVQLKHPKTGELSSSHIIGDFADWLKFMAALVKCFRSSTSAHARCA